MTRYITNYRTFNGKRYESLFWTTNKRNAEKYANDKRKSGHLARITEKRNGKLLYVVYVR